MAQDAYAAPSILPSSATFSTLQAGGVAGMLAAVVAANPQIASPNVQATVNPTGGGTTGGLLPAGTYYLKYTWTDGAGETTAGTSESASFTVSAGNIPQVTIPSLPTGACAANVYLTSAGGAAGTEVLYATGIAATTFNLGYAGPAWANTNAPPAANTTGASNQLAKIDAGGTGNWWLVWQRLSTLISLYIGGRPVDYYQNRAELSHIDYCFALWHQVMKEAMTLIAASPGTLKTVQGATVPRTYRAVGTIQ